MAAVEPVTQRVKRLLAAGRKLSFGDIHKGVLVRGPATKFAVRSALGKAREKGVIRFADGLYWMTGNKKPAPARGQSGSSEAAT